MNKQIWLPETMKSIEGKNKEKQIEILLDKLMTLAITFEQVTPSEIRAITGAPMEECSNFLNF